VNNFVNSGKTVIVHNEFILLAQEMCLLPLTSELRKKFNILFLPLTDEGLEELPIEITSLCVPLSGRGTVIYVEAEFFGGVGTQANTIFKEGYQIRKVLISKHAINETLRSLGVKQENGSEEFSALGLEKHRDTDQWLA